MDRRSQYQRYTIKTRRKLYVACGGFGGELGIRTLEAFRLTAFRVLHLRPLGQLSVYVIPFSFEKLFARTDGKNNKIFNFRTEQKLSVYGDLEGSILPNSQKISSQARYDHFDTLPYMLTRFREVNAIFYCLRIFLRFLTTQAFSFGKILSFVKGARF